jgi:hypothetical protein
MVGHIGLHCLAHDPTPAITVGKSALVLVVSKYILRNPQNDWSAPSRIHASRAVPYQCRQCHLLAMQIDGSKYVPEGHVLVNDFRLKLAPVSLRVTVEDTRRGSRFGGPNTRR